MLLDQLLVKMPHVEIEILLPIQLQHPLRVFQRNPFRTRPPLSSIVESVITMLLVAFPPPPQAAV
jgi:hypothetical protein